MVSTRWMLVTFACQLVVTRAEAPDSSRLANVLFSIGLIPDEGLASTAAKVLVDGAEAASEALQQALSALGIAEGKRTEGELFYSYGRSPPVYPSRM